MAKRKVREAKIAGNPYNHWWCPYDADIKAIHKANEAAYVAILGTKPPKD